MNKEIAERIQMINEGKVPEGYKKINDMVIPIDWEFKKLKDIITLISGQHIKASDYNQDKNGIPYLTGPSDFINEEPYITRYTSTPKSMCSNGDILITVKGSGVGKSFIVNSKYCIGRQFMAIQAQDQLRSLIYYNLQQKEENYNSDSAGLIPGITRFDIESSNIFLSKNNAENEKIGVLLSILDKVIKLKQNLLQEKQKQKKGLMERLLTEKIRINGFNEKWKKLKLGTVMKERNEIGYNDLELLAITSANGVVRRTEVDIKDTSSEDKSKYKRILPGDIGYNTMRMWQGVSGLSKYEGIVSPAYTILKPTEKVDSEFMSYLFKLPKVINLFYRYSQGLVSDTYNLKYENFKGIKVNIPTEVKEQKQIATILRIADKEIDLLKKELEALKQQKKGLMQLLLTGIVRVKSMENK